MSLINGVLGVKPRSVFPFTMYDSKKSAKPNVFLPFATTMPPLIRSGICPSTIPVHRVLGGAPRKGLENIGNSCFMNAAIQLLRPICQFAELDKPVLQTVLASVEAGKTTKEELIALRRELTSACIFTDDSTAVGETHPTKQQDVVDVLNWALGSLQTFLPTPAVNLQFAPETAVKRPYPQVGTTDDATGRRTQGSCRQTTADLALKPDAKPQMEVERSGEYKKSNGRKIQKRYSDACWPVFIKTEGRGNLLISL